MLSLSDCKEIQCVWKDRLLEVMDKIYVNGERGVYEVTAHDKDDIYFKANDIYTTSCQGGIANKKDVTLIPSIRLMKEKLKSDRDISKALQQRILFLLKEKSHE